jgi:hypothetical protein
MQNEVKQRIQELLAQGETVYGADIHQVGFELIIKDISLEEIIGGNYLLNGRYISKTLFDELHGLLYPAYVQQGMQRKSRGLY